MTLKPAQFVTPLVVELLDDLACDGRGIWRMVKSFRYYSALLGREICVEEDFLTDFTSVPRIVGVYDLLGDTSHKASVLHDWLFHHHEICDEQMANKVLLEASVVEGIAAWRRFLIYLGVVFGGESSWEEDGRGNGHSIVNGRIV